MEETKVEVLEKELVHIARKLLQIKKPIVTFNINEDGMLDMAKEAICNSEQIADELYNLILNYIDEDWV